MSGSICVVGSLNMDLVVYTPRLPAAGETILGDSFQTFPGGKGANQAVAAARLGAVVKIIGKIGKDAFGRQLLENLTANQVDVQGIHQDENMPTGTALITVDQSGQNSIIVVPGSNMELSPEDIEASKECILRADMLLLQLEIPLQTVQYAAQIAHLHKIPVILNPAPAQALAPELLRLVDYLVLNESETALLSGLPAGSLEETIQAALQLKSHHQTEVIVTLGEQGAIWIDGDQSRHLPAIPVTAVDSTAAGDAFIGGMATALLDHRSILEAIYWGNACGALSVMARGAQSSLPRREAVQEMIRQHYAEIS